jgi:hypothetical protein
LDEYRRDAIKKLEEHRQSQKSISGEPSTTVTVQ